MFARRISHQSNCGMSLTTKTAQVVTSNMFRWITWQLITWGVWLSHFWWHCLSVCLVYVHQQLINDVFVPIRGATIEPQSHWVCGVCCAAELIKGETTQTTSHWVVFCCCCWSCRVEILGGEQTGLFTFHWFTANRWSFVGFWRLLSQYHPANGKSFALGVKSCRVFCLYNSAAAGGLGTEEGEGEGSPQWGHMGLTCFRWSMENES